MGVKPHHMPTGWSGGNRPPQGRSWPEAMALLTPTSQTSSRAVLRRR